MRTPEQILNECHERDAKEKGITCIMPDHFPAAYAGSALMAMQEHAIEFAEWLRQAEWMDSAKALFKQGNYSELYKLCLKSIEPKTT